MPYPVSPLEKRFTPFNLFDRAAGTFRGEPCVEL